MNKSSFVPLRVDIKTGRKLKPTGADPRYAKWVQGAAETLPGTVRRKHETQIIALKEARAKMKRKGRDDQPTTTARPRTAGFKSLDSRPLPTSRDIDDTEADNR